MVAGLCRSLDFQAPFVCLAWLMEAGYRNLLPSDLRSCLRMLFSRFSWLSVTPESLIFFKTPGTIRESHASIITIAGSSPSDWRHIITDGNRVCQSSITRSSEIPTEKNLSSVPSFAWEKVFALWAHKQHPHWFFLPSAGFATAFQAS